MMIGRAGYRIILPLFQRPELVPAPSHKCLSLIEIFIQTSGCKLAPDRYNGAARQLVSVVMVTPSVPPQRLPVNLVRSGRKQPQREHCVPGCGWWGHHLNEPLSVLDAATYPASVQAFDLNLPFSHIVTLAIDIRSLDNRRQRSVHLSTYSPPSRNIRRRSLRPMFSCLQTS